MKTTSLAIFIDSYDGCSDIWKSFFKIFDSYWPSCSFPKYLITNSKTIKEDKLTIVHTGDEINWFDRTIRGLESVNEDYILFLLEDYFISKKTNDQDLSSIVQSMQEKDIYYYQLSGPLKKLPDCPDGFGKIIPQNTKYPISLQIAIWNKAKFLDVLMEMQRNGAKSPWDFERYYVELYSKAYSASCMQAIPGARADARDLLGYKNGVLQGKWIRATLRFYKKQGIKLDTSGREIMSVKDTVNYNLKVFGALYLKGKFGGTLKKVLRVFGYKFMS